MKAAYVDGLEALGPDGVPDYRARVLAADAFLAQAYGKPVQPTREEGGLTVMFVPLDRGADWKSPEDYQLPGKALLAALPPAPATERGRGGVSTWNPTKDPLLQTLAAHLPAPVASAVGFAAMFGELEYKERVGRVFYACPSPSPLTAINGGGWILFGDVDSTILVGLVDGTAMRFQDADAGRPSRARLGLLGRRGLSTTRSPNRFSTAARPS